MREIICAYNILQKVKDKFIKRICIGDIFAPKDCFYYQNKNGRVRKINTVDGSIWQYDDTDYIGPYYTEKIRTVKAFILKE